MKKVITVYGFKGGVGSVVAIGLLEANVHAGLHFISYRAVGSVTLDFI